MIIFLELSDFNYTRYTLSGTVEIEKKMYVELLHSELFTDLKVQFNVHFSNWA